VCHSDKDGEGPLHVLYFCGDAYTKCGGDVMYEGKMFEKKSKKKRRKKSEKNENKSLQL
jgi:NRPS condensation-like uncharacterized protein